MSKTWTVTLEDGGNDEVILPFPEEMMTEAGWLEGDELDFVVEGEAIVVTNLSWKKRNA